MMKSVGCLLWLILSLSGTNGEYGGFEELDRTSKELGAYLGLAVEATDALALERYNQAINVFGECLQNDDNEEKCLSRLEEELKHLDRVFRSGIDFAHVLVQEGLAMNAKAITNRINWLNNVDTEEVELLEDTQGLLEEQTELIDNTINALARQKEFSVDCEVEGVAFSDDDLEDEDIQVSFEAIINMALVRNGMDDYVSNFSWDGAAERRQTVRNLRLRRRSIFLRGRGSRGCRACSIYRAISDVANRKLELSSQLSGIDSTRTTYDLEKDLALNSGTTYDLKTGIDSTRTTYDLEKDLALNSNSGTDYDLKTELEELALKSQFNWKEDSYIDSIANPKVCLAGESLNFVNDPLAYLITAKLGVDVTDNESFSVTCCFHFDV
jgi:hypothetical protein